MRNVGWFTLAVASIACSGSGSGTTGPSSHIDGVPLIQGFDPGPAPDPSKGFQIVLPAVSNIEAGQSYEYCTWTDVITTKDIWVKSFAATQSETGHHVAVFYTTQQQQPGTSRICKDSDMATFRFAIAGTGIAAQQAETLPGDLAVHIPAGAQIAINHHYLNASGDSVAQAQSALNIYYASGTPTQASSVAFVDTAMSIPPGPASVDIDCTVKQDLATWYFIPHMHNWGKHITVDHISGSTTDRLFDVDWDPEYAFHPPAKTEDPARPYILHAGDKIHVHCDYDNTTNAPLTFGDEMCVAFAQDVDTARVGNLACDSGTWTTF